MEKKKIIFSGGGTGGHIYPILSIVRALKKAAPDMFDFYYLGPKDNPEFITPLSLEGVKIKFIKAGKLRRYANIGEIIENFIDLFFNVPIGFLQAFGFIFSKSPDLIFCKGGYGSLPTALAGAALRVPIFLHESDLEPGFANKIISKFSLLIFTSFEETGYFDYRKTIFVGNPLRSELFEMTYEQAKGIINVTGDKKVMAVLGGSQGATFLNNFVLNVIDDLINHFEVIHQIGPYRYKEVSTEALASLMPDKRKYYHPFSVLSERQLAATYKLADIIISRGGAGAIFEIAASGKPSIIIPFPFASRHHQAKNAFYYQKKGGCVVLEQELATPHFILEKAKEILRDTSLRNKLIEGAKSFAIMDAGEKIANYIISYLYPQRSRQKKVDKYIGEEFKSI